ncbi:hypothetical protein IB680_05645 [Francisella philomiragia]|uniref:hypothetical protein n=1 Tax=Francisella philomiragia TaxID=28110 RepID=UPI0019042CDE|nr:hypothetical protein [Francisella philomiragia]MBK2095157.1 hypothetical protein [Francisella philomiragia]
MQNVKPYRIKSSTLSNISEDYKKEKKERLFSINVKGKDVLKADELRKAFFNSRDDRYDVFISYSYKDKDLALKLAGYIEFFSKGKVFCDYAEWGDYRTLLKKIDNEFCNHSNGTSYDYDKRNNSTAHIHMLLASSLFQIMTRAKMVIFITSDNLIVENDISEGLMEEETTSPWIYFEYLLADFLKPKTHTTYDSINEKIQLSRDLQVNHKVDISSFDEITSLDNLISKFKDS